MKRTRTFKRSADFDSLYGFSLTFKQHIKDTIKDLQTSGANLTKVWTSLSTLRSSIKKYSAVSTATELLASLPDPLPPPSSHQMMRTTRHAVNATVLVAQSSQMVPVVIALVEATLRTEAVRGEIEDGVKDGKEKARESKELMKAEMERWDKVKEKETNHKSKEVRRLYFYISVWNARLIIPHRLHRGVSSTGLSSMTWNRRSRLLCLPTHRDLMARLALI